MHSRFGRAIPLLLLVIIGISLYGETEKAEIPVSYWLWAGITPEDAPSSAELYVFQGRIITKEGASTYERLGLYPHPVKSDRLYLVYRLDGQLPDAQTVVGVFEHSVAQWQRHPVTVSGIQLDFDCPTSKLSTYGRFMQDIREKLAARYGLSVTGLMDWATSGDKEAMRSISESADEIVFQLYRGRRPLPEIESSIRVLGEYSMPFRIGLLSGSEAPKSVVELEANQNFRGIIYFIQKRI